MYDDAENEKFHVVNFLSAKETSVAKIPKALAEVN